MILEARRGGTPPNTDRRLFIANARSKNFADWVQAIAQLRAAGLAE
jgi:hypothetical protein